MIGERSQLRLFDKLASLFIFTLPKIQRCVLFGFGRMPADKNNTNRNKWRSTIW